MPRENLDSVDTVQDLVVLMAEGNPGGLNVMMGLLKENGTEIGAALIVKLDEMNMRGPQIWVGYKDHCGQDLEAFAKAIIDGDQSMVDKVNQECYHPNLVEQYGEAYSHKAVRGEVHGDPKA